MQPQSDGNEDLVRAAMLGDRQSVERLINTPGVEANYKSSKNSSGMTALMWAAAEGHLEIARALIEKGADINAKNSAGLTALVYCFENMVNANPRPMPAAGFPGIPGKKVPPQVQWKKETGHLGIAKILMVKGADVLVKNDYNETMLHLAAKKGQTELCKLLCDRGVEIEAKNRGYGHTAMHIAAIENHPDIVEALAERGANVNVKNVVGWTPLIWAAARGNIDAVKVLLEKNADPNIKALATGARGDTSQTTALLEGRKCDSPETMSRILVRGGANG